MRSFQHLSSLCVALFVLLGPVKADLNNDTSPTSIFRSVSPSGYQRVYDLSDLLTSDRIYMLPSSSSTSSGRNLWLQDSSFLLHTGTRTLDCIFMTIMDNSCGQVQVLKVAQQHIIHISASTKAKTTFASFRDINIMDGRADMVSS